jgi:GxxExxY protein
VIVDVNVVTDLNEPHVAQMIGYLNILELNVGRLINFKNSTLRFKRVAT